MGPRDPGEAGSCGMVGERREPLPAEVPVHELDAPHSGGPRVEQGRAANQEGVRPLARTILHGRWRVLHGWFQEGPPVRDREHSARPRAILVTRIIRRSAGRSSGLSRIGTRTAVGVVLEVVGTWTRGRA